MDIGTGKPTGPLWTTPAQKPLRMAVVDDHPYNSSRGPKLSQRDHATIIAQRNCKHEDIGMTTLPKTSVAARELHYEG
jgi:hypothetical protein